ncbi:hypothetical protein AK830_g11789 [Neonectria ditissima]|uniref:Pisatin demethylase n=1 Tax=Neonectria ditissima TaxID=78410 RepID=A0A0P7ALE2_9HYPO|nr:hypothetical protein AK830_g11789 [Neonectria ditissima]
MADYIERDLSQAPMLFGRYSVSLYLCLVTTGPIVRIAPNEYSIDDPSAVQVIYGSRGRFTKSSWYDASEFPGQPNIFSDHNIERHAADDCTSILCARLDELAHAATLVDIGCWMQFYAFDVISKMTLDEPFGCLTTGKDFKGIIHTLESSLFYAARVGIYSFLHPVLFWFSMLVNAKGMDNEVKNDAEDFITKFQRIRQENPEKINKDDIISSAVANISAGSDTTSISLTSVIYNLCKFLDVLAKLRNELEDAVTAGDITDPITFKQAQNLPYLQAVVKEALRIHPATGLTLGRVVPEGGATIAKRFFPAGTTVGINAWVAGRNKVVYGEDVEVFRPERWLEDMETVKRREAYFMTFGSGPRTCFGKNISLLEMVKVIPVLVLNYDFKAEFQGRPYRTENVWFVKQKDFRCQVIKRHFTHTSQAFDPPGSE